MNTIVNPILRFFIYLILGSFFIYIGSCSPNDVDVIGSKSSIGSDIVSRDDESADYDTNTKESATSSRGDLIKMISEASLVRMLATSGLSGVTYLEMAERLETASKIRISI